MKKAPVNERKLLILDIDETLVFSTGRKLENVAPDFEIGSYRVYKRPHLDTFLDQCADLFEVALWTAGSSGYAQAIAQRLIIPRCEPSFVWSRERCTIRHDRWSERVFVKNLKKVKRLGYDLGKVIFIDNSPEKHIHNWGNLVPVKDFEGQQDDDELALLTGYLPWLALQPNVRAIDKRQWRAVQRGG